MAEPSNEAGVFQQLGRDVRSDIEPLFELFRNDDIAPAAAAVLLGIAVAFVVGFSVYAAYARWRIEECRREVLRHGSRAEFAHALGQVEKTISGHRLLRHSWQEFRESLIEAEANEDASPAVRNTVRPQAYFNMAEAGLHFRFLRALPNVFVGVGLLLTFFGLVSALFFATGAIDEAGKDFLKSQEALKGLLHAASFKFYTSVAGLAGSILLSIVLRVGTSVIEAGFAGLAAALEQRMQFVTPEWIAFKQLRQAEEQTNNLKLFNTEVAIAVGRHVEQALNATLPDHLSKAMEPVARALGEVGEKLTGMNQSAISELANGFAQKLQGASGQQMQALADTLGELKGSLLYLNEKMAESGTGFAEKVAQSTEEMRQAIAAMTGAIQEVAARAEKGMESSQLAINQQIAAAITALEDMSRRLAETMDGVGARLTSGTETAAGEFVRQFGAGAAAMEAASERTAQRIEQAVNQIMNAATAAGERAATATEEKIAGAAKQVSAGLAGIGNDFAASIDRLTQGLTTTAEEMRRIEARIADHRQALEDMTRTTQETEGAMTGITKSLRDASTPLTESNRLIVDATRRIEESTGGVRDMLTAAGAEMRTLTDGLKATIAASEKAWADYERRFIGVDQSLDAVLTKIVQHIRVNVDALHEYTVKVDSQIAKSLDHLGGGIADLAEFADTMEKATNRIEGLMARSNSAK